MITFNININVSNALQAIEAIRAIEEAGYKMDTVSTQATQGSSQELQSEEVRELRDKYKALKGKAYRLTNEAKDKMVLGATIAEILREELGDNLLVEEEEEEEHEGESY